MNFKSRLAASAAVAALSLGLANGAYAADAAVSASGGNEDDVIVTAKSAQSTLAQEPGGVTVLGTDALQTQALPNTATLLKYVPGLFAASTGGGESTRLSIRGSGRGSGGFTWGASLQVLVDGLPLNTIVGNPYEAYEPNAYRSVEVLKGANAFDYGAYSLGGAINFLEHTGYDSDKLFVRAEGGSYGYNREQISSGQVIGNLDYYVSLTHFSQDGYLDNSSSSSARVVSNIGYRFNDSLENRFYFEFATQRQNGINDVTLYNLSANPQLNTGTWRLRTNFGTYILADKARYNIDKDSTLEIGVQWQRPPITDAGPVNVPIWDVATLSGSARYTRKDLIGGHESDTTVSLLSSGLINSTQTTTVQPTGARTGGIAYGGYNTTLLVSNDFAIRPDLWLQLGIGGLWLQRHNQILNAVAAGVNPTLDKSYTDVTPRIGLRYQVKPNIEFYGNVSRLVEAPQVGSYAQQVNFVYSGYTVVSNGANERNLTTQTGTSADIGVRGSIDRVRWDVDYFHEDVRNELLTTYTLLPNVNPAIPNGLSYTGNASPTVHQGVELSVDADLWKEGQNSVSLHQAYTWGDYHFVHQSAVQKTLPGIPSNVYQAELNFNHASGVYLKGSLDYVGGYPADYANALFAPSYTLLGASAGYSPPGAKWRIFVQGTNLTDKRYVSFTDATGLATASSAVFSPGVGRSVTGGATYAF